MPLHFVSPMAAFHRPHLVFSFATPVATPVIKIKLSYN